MSDIQKIRAYKTLDGEIFETLELAEAHDETVKRTEFDAWYDTAAFAGGDATAFFEWVADMPIAQLTFLSEYFSELAEVKAQPVPEEEDEEGAE